MADAPPKLPDVSSTVEPTLPEPKPISEGKRVLFPPSSSPIAGTKRPAPSLLPAFEPLSSSPGLPRPLKRQNTGGAHSSNARLKYPTPVPTSSTAILSSSPPQQHIHRRPFVRTSTNASEREPLSALPTTELPENGEVLMMGRSSNSSHFQLSSNRLVSRVHVKARYIPAVGPLDAGKMEIVCNGWNGVKVHCQGRTWELLKGDTFTSETEGSDIMLEVHDARVLVQWPRRGADALANLSDSSWDDVHPAGLHSSPLRRNMHLQSPESPTPAHLGSSQRLQALFPRRNSREDEPSIQIYEDEAEPELPPPQGESVDVGASMRTEVTASFSSDLSDPVSDVSDGECDPNEENDPIVHSFGPFGANIAGRLASISTGSPKAKSSPKTTPSARAPPSARALQPVMEASRQHDTPGEITTPINEEREMAEQGQEQEQDRACDSDSSLTPLKGATPSPPPKATVSPAIVNHAINQLAFSRLSSTPLSTIMQHLPGDTKIGLTREALRDAIESTRCIGIIERQGKDAAGKALESEYYYVPESDDDEQRRAAVVDGLRKPSLRNCRKQHKVSRTCKPCTPRIAHLTGISAILLETSAHAVKRMWHLILESVSTQRTQRAILSQDMPRYSQTSPWRNKLVSIGAD